MNATRPPRPLALLLGGLLTTALVLAAALSWLWTPHAFEAMNLAQRFAPPSAQHWLGTDAYGRDIASQLLVGARSTLAVGLVAVGLGLLLGTGLGLLAAARRGWVEQLTLRLADFSLAFPALLTAILLVPCAGRAWAMRCWRLRCSTSPSLPAWRGPAPPACGRKTMCLRPAPAAKAGGALPGSTSCPTAPGC